MKQLSVLKFTAMGLTSMISFALIPVIIRLIDANPLTIAFVRLIIAICLSAIFFLKREEIYNSTKKDLLIMASIGISFAIHWWLYFLSIKMTSAAEAMIGISTYGVQIILISIIVTKRSVRGNEITSILLVILGVLLAMPSNTQESTKTIGFIFGIVSAFFYAVLPTLHQKINHVSTQLRSFFQFFFAGLFFIAFLPWMDFNLEIKDWAGLVYLGAIGTFVGHSLWVHFTTYVAVVPASLIYYLNLPLAIFFAWLLLNEEITLSMVGGAFLIIVGNIMGILKQIKHKKFFIE